MKLSHRGWIAAALGLIVLIAAVVMTRALTLNDAQIASEQAQAAAVAVALSDADSARARQAPVLTAPANDAALDNAAAVVLTWSWGHPLAENEFFDLRVWRDGDPDNGITWTKDSSFDLRDWLLYQAPGHFNWSVDVIARADDGSGTPVSEMSPAFGFTISVIDMPIINVPPDFSARYYGHLPFKQPTALTFAPDGSLYVLGVEGEIARLTDEDGDGFAETITIVYPDADNLLDHAVGMTFDADGTLYISDAERISTLTDSDGDGEYDTVTPIVEGLPSQWWTFHSNNGIAFGPDGKLYVGVGSTTDHGPLRHPLEASILRVNPDGSDLETFATGLRNPYDLVFTPEGDLFTADNSPDSLDATLPYLPPEELDHIQQGRDYGFPDQFGFPDSASDTVPPVVELFTSSASSGISYTENSAFPPEYHGVYLAQFGTGADFPASMNVQTGRQVVLIRLTPDGAGSFTGTWQPFASFNQTLDAIYTPIDVTFDADGALYVMEWDSATIYRVTYTPGAEATPEAASATAESDAHAEMIALGDTIFHNGAAEAPACIGCHTLSGEDTATAPSLAGLSDRAGARVAGLSAEDYVHQSIIDPNAFVVPGYGAGLMFQQYAEKLSPEQIDALVAYVLSL